MEENTIRWLIIIGIALVWLLVIWLLVTHIEKEDKTEHEVDDKHLPYADYELTSKPPFVRITVIHYRGYMIELKNGKYNWRVFEFTNEKEALEAIDKHILQFKIT